MSMSGRPRQPIDLIVAKGKKHLTKDEIERRRAEELQVPDDAIAPPKYLTKRQREEFRRIADTLIQLKIMKNLDVDALAAYIVERDEWLATIKQLHRKGVRDDIAAFDKLSRIEERYRKQMRASASDLGLSITSRGKLVMPTEETPIPHDNKFAKFSAVTADG